MANTIDTQTGVVGGVVTTGDATGALNIQTLATNAILIDTSQNVTIPKLAVSTSLNVTGSSTFSGSVNFTGGVSGGGFSNIQVFTASGTFTVPANVTKAKVTVVGGGGGASYSTAGTGGGTSSFGAFCSATGGTVGFNGTGGTGGIGSGGALNIRGGYSIGGTNGGSDGFFMSISGGPSIFGNASYGAGALGDWQNAGGIGVGAGGGGGGTAICIATGLTPGGTVSVTVGAAGTGNIGTGYAGVVIVEY